jgi:hypothetical protein
MALATSGLGNLASFATKEFGGGEGLQSGAKVGTMLLTSMLGGPGVRRLMKDKYDEVEALLPRGQELSMDPAKATIQKLDRMLSEGGSTGSKAYMKKRIKEIKQKSYYGTMRAEDVLAFKRDASEWIKELPDPQRFQKLIPTLQHDFSKILEQTGASNPEFIKALRTADNIYKGLITSWPVNKALEKYISPEKIGVISGAVLLGSHSPVSAAKAMAVPYTVKHVMKGVEVLSRSSEARKYYGKALAAAAKNNGPVLTKMASKMDEAITKVLPENKAITSGRYRLTE